MVAPKYVIDVPPPTRMSNWHRWDQMYEYAGSIPHTIDYDHFSNHFNSRIKDVMPLFIQWEILGWMPKTNTNGQWRYKEAFDLNGGSYTLVNDFGQKLSLLVKILEISVKSQIFSEVTREVFTTIQSIRMNILKMRWREFAAEILDSSSPEFLSKLHNSAVDIDIFRILCLDFLSRNGVMNKSDIVMIWSIFSNRRTSTLEKFRANVDHFCSDHVVEYANDELENKYELAMSSYIFKEFEVFGSTFELRLIPLVEGSYEEGFKSISGLEKIVNGIIGDE